jgi:hypothetical protein
VDARRNDPAVMETAPGSWPKSGGIGMNRGVVEPVVVIEAADRHDVIDGAGCAAEPFRRLGIPRTDTTAHSTL